MYGAEYIRAIVSLSPAPVLAASAQAAREGLACLAPPQPDVERDLAQYERYVANRESLPEGVLR